MSQSRRRDLTATPIIYSMQTIRLLLLVLLAAFVAADCSIYGNCGKKSLFGSELPCPTPEDDSGPFEASKEDLQLLGEICGESWTHEKLLCCDTAQIKDLKNSLKKADGLISSCPACKANFYEFFCKFTCSSDQRDYVNVTQTAKSSDGRDIVTELSYFVEPQWAQGFYDSCKDIKFSATNGYAMDLLGGGRRGYKNFLKFLGDEKPMLGGSPFQINFPWPKEQEGSNRDKSYPPKGIKPVNPVLRDCAKGSYKCACSDCETACPELPSLAEKQACRVGVLPCLSFAVIIIYTVILTGAVVGSWFVQSRTCLLSGGEVPTDTYVTSRFFQNPFASETYTTYPINGFLQHWASRIALVCATYPGVTIASTVCLIVLMSAGLTQFQVEENPVKLWVSEDSTPYQQKLHFDNNFGPFYRTSQVYVVNTTGPVVTQETLQWWKTVEERITSLEIDGTTFDDFCLKPTNDFCVIQSYTQYGINLAADDWATQLQTCTSTAVQCLPPFGQPLNMNLLFGGYNETSNDPLSAKALVITLVGEGFLEEDPREAAAEKWEKGLIDVMLEVQEEAKQRGLQLSFSTETSLTEELNKSTNTDVKIIIISYLVMFLYASLALGGILPSPSNMVDTKFSLGLSGIVIVLFSVAGSAGVCAALGIKATLIIAEVIPFLVLAVGVDNIFLLSHEMEAANIAYPNESINLRVSKAVGRIGPSIVISAVTETLAFALAASVKMPAVRNFAIYAAGAVFINAILQLTAFVSILALDQKRAEAGRLDVFPLIKVSRRIQLTDQQVTYDLDFNMLEHKENFFSKLIRRWYAPFLLKSTTKKVVIFVFATWAAFSLIIWPMVQLGLDQRLAVPSGSYLVQYFDDIYSYLNVGPPLYFVVSGLNATTRAGQQSLCGTFTTCQDYSLVNIVEQERKRPEISYIGEPASSWIDDYLKWLNPDLDECCRLKKNRDGSVEKDVQCAPRASPRACQVCFKDRDPAWNISMSGLPIGSEFMHYFDFWIESPSDPCPLGGEAPYGDAVVSDGSDITTSHFRSFHTPLRSQSDFIAAVASAKRISKDIEHATKANVYAYSPFYIFFDQYSYIIKQAFALIGGVLAAVFVLLAVILGSIKTSFAVVLTVTLMIINIVGFMAMWNVNLNAISLVNLVICVGLGVEFCVHLARAYTTVSANSSHIRISPTKTTRTFEALVGVGGSVFGGIAMTKFLGVFVLAFTRSRIFEVYYFRVWLALVITATTHSLILFPVLLTFIGGKGYIYDDGEQDLEGELASRFLSSYENAESDSE